MPLLGYHSCPIGLDISELSIKLIQLKKRGDKIAIQAVGRTSLPNGVLDDGEIKDKDTLARYLKKLISHPSYGKVIGNEVVVCLSETKTFLKMIEVDKNTQDLSESVKAELIKHIPLPIEEIYYDFQTIRESNRSQIMLLGASPKDIVDQHTSFFRENKLTVVAMETEPLSVCRALLPEEHIKYKDENKNNYAIIDIGATSASMTVYAKNTILFAVSMPISGENLTSKIAETLDIEPSRAEKAKVIYSLQEGDEQPAIKKILSEMVNELVKKSKEAITFFHHHFSTWGPIDKIILCGGGANIKDVEKTIQKEIGISTIRGDALINLGDNKAKFSKPFQETMSLYVDFLSEDKKKIKGKKREEKALKITQDTSLSYTTAIGLGLRGAFNHELDA
jgi:type IV pilus assembly protein PilM